MDFKNCWPHTIMLVSYFGNWFINDAFSGCHVHLLSIVPNVNTSICFNCRQFWKALYVNVMRDRNVRLSTFLDKLCHHASCHSQVKGFAKTIS